jgi:hypothetical protein
MVDLAKEQVFPLAVPPVWLVGRTGKTVHRTTLERWHKLGLKGGQIKLETTLVGATRVSSVEAVERFLAQLNGQAPTPDDAAPASTSKPTRTPCQLRKASEDAAAKLARAGY